MQPAPTENDVAGGPAAATGPALTAEHPVDGPVQPDAPPLPVEAAACPLGHGRAASTGCPVAHDPAGPSRSRADLIVRKVLRIHDRPAAAPRSGSAYGSFQRSMLISAVRCTLTYVIFPFVAPAVGFATGVGPVVGVLLGSFAMVCDVFTIRRFFAVDHRWRWPVSTVAFCVICLLAVLLVQDIGHLLR